MRPSVSTPGLWDSPGHNLDAAPQELIGSIPVLADPTEEAAEAAVNRNSLVLNPSINSPTKITGTYQLLVERFGDDGATEIITKNPVCAHTSAAFAVG